MAERSDGTQPAYVSYLTLKNTVESFAESTVPTRLDAHVLHNFSGATRSQLMSALKFLKLIDSDGAVNEDFKAMVEARKAGEREYQERMAATICDAYVDIVGGLDIDRGTLPELEKAFRDAGVPQGQMLMKSVRFYIRALTDCGIKLSPHITKPRRKASKAASNQKTPRRQQTPPAPPPSNKDTKVDTIPEGFSRLPIPGLEDAFIQYPADLTQGHITLFKGGVEYLATFVKVREEGPQ